MIDFDKKFQEYLEKWTEDNAGKYTYDEMEDLIPQIYGEWLIAPDAELSGKSPSEIVDAMTPVQLIEEFSAAFENGGEPSSIVLDRIESVPECAEFLINVLKGEQPDEVKIHAANMLREMDQAGNIADILLNWLEKDGFSQDLKDVATELLTDHAEDVKESLFAIIGSAGKNVKTLIAEILVCAERDERTYELLCELFNSGENIALYASYFAKYGDERAAALLYKALDTCNYLEFTEIRNAIETLGGVVDDDYRDFSDDEDYQIIKNLK